MKVKPQVNINPKENLLFDAFFMFFLIHSIQTGVGIAGLPRIVYLSAGHDGWISIIIAGLLVSAVIFLSVMMLKQYESADLFGIHYDVFGIFLGRFVNLFYTFYLISGIYVIVMNYVEIVQAWVFPDLPTWFLAMILLLLSVYAVMGGVRIAVGFSFMSFLLTFWIVLIIIIPARDFDYTHLLPILNRGYADILKGVYKTSLSIVGFEMLLFLYPFIKNKKKAHLYTQLGGLYTTLLFVLVTVISIGFFGEKGLEKTIWPVLSMFKIVRLPNLERFEFIAVSFWMLIILPNICLYLWAASRGMKRVFPGMKQKTFIVLIAILVWSCSFLVKARYQMNLITDYIGMAGFYIGICYPALLSMLVLLKKKLTGRRKQNENGA
ncbi:GerAB/ArcD/ProY family transporter [Bacillus infantis]|uniref:GerAB/ArcD/ProY family transporter n=1 Tax=Bacillus infantis TaxID=324767 RepID=A0A5D4RH61_9BACI|nr:GerAB/ArcD/ProY family transporter [Bacillus infantis]